MTPQREAFINENYLYALKATQGKKVFPSVLLSQAIIESQRPLFGVYVPGESLLSKKYNNYFGIKADANYKGPSIYLSTEEEFNGVRYTVNGKFRVYNSKYESFKDYVNFLLSNPRYKSALEQTFASGQVKQIALAGYATASNYNEVLQSVLKGVEEVIKKKQLTPALASGGLMFLIFGIIALSSFNNN